MALVYNGNMDTNTQTETVAGGDPPVVDNQNADTLREQLTRVNRESAERRQTINAMKAELDALKAQQAAETEKRATEQGEYQKLWEAEKARATAAMERADLLDGQIKAQNVAMLRQKVATEKGLPAALAARLAGETVEEIAADADALLKALPVPATGTLNGGARGTGNGPTPAGMHRILTRYNIDPRYIEGE